MFYLKQRPYLSRRRRVWSSKCRRSHWSKQQGNVQ